MLHATNIARFCAIAQHVEAADHLEQLALDRRPRARGANRGSSDSFSAERARSRSGHRIANTRNASAAREHAERGVRGRHHPARRVGAAQREERAEHEQRDQAARRRCARPRPCRAPPIADIAALAQQARPHELAEPRRQREDRHEADRRDREQRPGRHAHAERREQVVPAQRAAQLHDDEQRRRRPRGTARTRAHSSASIAADELRARLRDRATPATAHSASIAERQARLIASFIERLVRQLAREDRARRVVEQPRRPRRGRASCRSTRGPAAACWRSPSWCASVATARREPDLERGGAPAFISRLPWKPPIAPRSTTNAQCRRSSRRELVVVPQRVVALGVREHRHACRPCGT